MASFNYITVEGDRIDRIAVRFYGSLTGISILAEANPGVPLEAAFPLGTVLAVPIIDDSEISDKSTLPPWKQ